MGSSGTGRFSDYPGSGSGRQGGSNRQGGSSGNDPCARAIEEQIEDVARCEYYRNHRQVPRTGTRVKVERGRRIEVKTMAGEVIGYLPTAYNYLAECLTDGYRYHGQIAISSTSPLPNVLVRIAAEPPRR